MLRYSCQLEHWRDVNGKAFAGLGGMQSGPHVGFHGGHTITIDKILPLLAIGASLGEHEEATHYLLSSALHTKHVYICPHMNSVSPELFGGKTNVGRVSRQHLLNKSRVGIFASLL
jgi:hypothetical protein